VIYSAIHAARRPGGWVVEIDCGRAGALNDDDGKFSSFFPLFLCVIYRCVENKRIGLGEMGHFGSS
jgi:hypothetical protein